MKTIGVFVKEARIAKRFSFNDLENETKIKTEFLKAVESESWNKLPEYPVVVGFVKSIARALGISKDTVVALLRRDYPPNSRTFKLNPEPDIKQKFIWSPKLTFFLGIFAVFALTVVYLVVQYKNYVQPPVLAVQTPQEAEKVTRSPLLVSGTTDPEASVVINNQPTLVSEEGYFSAEIEIFEGTREIKIIAKSRSGKETSVVRTIEPNL